jgi:hypothetical protein
MATTIKCDQMTEGWDSDVCMECKNFSTGRTAKGRNWRCKLNNKSAAERRGFYMIWATDYLIMCGKLNENLEEKVVVDYIGKKKRKKKGEK